MSRKTKYKKYDPSVMAAIAMGVTSKSATGGDYVEKDVACQTR